MTNPDQTNPDQITVTRTIDAPIERVFAMLADPDQHHVFDGSRSVRASETHSVLTEVGDVFRMKMHRDDLGDYESENVVTSYERDVAISWAPGQVGKDPLRHSYAYRLEADGPDRTAVTLTYDWSAVTHPKIRPMLPMVSREELEQSLKLLAEALLAF
jgi:uncharacterized protein YndB with AHSA1/START domain